MFELIALQAQDREVVYSVGWLTEEMLDEAAPHMFKRLDHELLEQCGYVDRTRLRLTYEQPHVEGFKLDMHSFIPQHGFSPNVVHLLDGPKAGEKVGLRPPSRAILFPVIGKDYDHYEYTTHKFRDLVFGVWDERSGKRG